VTKCAKLHGQKENEAWEKGNEKNMRHFTFSAVDNLHTSVVVLDKETADWYKASFPNRDGMTTFDAGTNGYADITDIYRNGQLVGKRFDIYD
jgi:hypothetical protein